MKRRVSPEISLAAQLETDEKGAFHTGATCPREGNLFIVRGKILFVGASTNGARLEE